MTDKKSDKTEEAGDKRRRSSGKRGFSFADLRAKLASLVWIVAVVCALILAVGALLVALKANQDNTIVGFVLDSADTLDLGLFSRENGIFTFEGANAAVKSALVNWGIGAIAYLIAGKILDRLIRA